MKVSNKYSEIGVPRPAPGGGHDLYNWPLLPLVPIGIIVDGMVLVEADPLSNTAKWEPLEDYK